MTASDRAAINRRGFISGFGAMGAGAALMAGVTSNAAAAAESASAPKSKISVGKRGPDGGTVYSAPAGFDPLSAQDNLRMWLRLLGYRNSG